MVVAVVEVCETGVCVDMRPGNEIVVAERAIVDYAVGCDGELNCLSEGSESHKGKEFGEVLFEMSRGWEMAGGKGVLYTSQSEKMRSDGDSQLRIRIRCKRLCFPKKARNFLNEE